MTTIRNFLVAEQGAAYLISRGSGEPQVLQPDNSEFGPQAAYLPDTLYRIFFGGTRERALEQEFRLGSDIAWAPDESGVVIQLERRASLPKGVGF